MNRLFNRLALVLLSITAAASTAHADGVTQDDWGKLFSAIRSESWKDAVDLSLDVLDRLPQDADVELARARYMYLFALSGEVTAGELTHEEFAAKLESLVGQRMVLPGHPVADPKTNGPMLSQIAKTDSPNTVMVIAANADASSIHTFEYATLVEPVDLSAHLDDIGYISGTLRRIEPNASGSDIWVARVYLEDASIAFASRH
jgi:hypothetical protein